MSKGSAMGVKSTTGATVPGAVKSSDGSGENHGRIKGGVAVGKADAGGGKLFNTGRSESVAYTHGRKSHQ